MHTKRPGKAKSLAPLAVRAQLRWDVVCPIVKSVSPRRTIEIGVGQGAMGARIALLTSESYEGFELDSPAYLRAKGRIEEAGGKIYNESLAEVDPEPADLLCAFEVLEHMEDDLRALEEWVSYVVPGGQVVLSVPANPRRFGPMDTYAGHFRRYSAVNLRQVAESAGLINVTTTLYGAPLGYALEAVRNRIDKRKLEQLRLAGGGELPSPESFTSASGRTFQFAEASWKSSALTAVTVPFKYAQRIWPDGVGLVMRADKPRRHQG